MEIKSAKFVISNTDPRKCPNPDRPEYAFIGRSNVGKSSLINMLVNHRKLAKTSSTPGKTQVINHFLVNGNWYIVDLPGYGYAKVSKSSKRKWEGFIQKYLVSRENLYCLFVLIDSRHEPQQIDLDFLEWLGIHEIPFAIVFTKIDKLSRPQTDKNVALYKKVLLQSWEELPPVFLTAAPTKQGREALLNFIGEVNER